MKIFSKCVCIVVVYYGLFSAGADPEGGPGGLGPTQNIQEMIPILTNTQVTFLKVIVLHTKSL